MPTLPLPPVAAIWGCGDDRALCCGKRGVTTFVKSRDYGIDHFVCELHGTRWAYRPLRQTGRATLCVFDPKTGNWVPRG